MTFATCCSCKTRLAQPPQVYRAIVAAQSWVSVAFRSNSVTRADSRMDARTISLCVCPNTEATSLPERRNIASRSRSFSLVFDATSDVLELLY